MALPAIFDTLRLPVIGAPLFIISTPDLVIAQCQAGVVGSFPALNARPQPVLEDWLIRITETLSEYDAAHPEAPSAPYAVNQIVHKSNDRLMADLELCVKYKVPIVITSLGARPEVNEAVHSYGGIVLHDIINPFFARKALDKGADGLIAVAAGAGGHAGTISPFALVAEIRAFFDGPIALSGAIATGGGIPGSASGGCRSRLYRLGFHCHTGGQCGRGLQAVDRGILCRGHHLFQSVHGHPRQLPAQLDRGGRAGPAGPAAIGPEQDEFRQREHQGRGATSGVRDRGWAASMRWLLPRTGWRTGRANMSRHRIGSGRRSFLKKRTKKLLRLSLARG